MARIRTLKPEAWADRKVGMLSLEARMLWVVLITMSDDYGAFEAQPAAIFGFGYRYQSDHLPRIEEWLTELEGVGLIVRYSAGDEQYGLFPRWSDHQNVKNPAKTRLPRPSDESTVIRGRVYGEPTEIRESPANEDTTPTLRRVDGDSTDRNRDLGPGIRDQGTGTSSGSALDRLSLIDLSAASSRFRSAWPVEEAEIRYEISLEPADVQEQAVDWLLGQYRGWNTNGVLWAIKGRVLPGIKAGGKRPADPASVAPVANEYADVGEAC